MRDDLSVSGDLIGGTVGDWLVAGWFTPDYRPLAETFAANLAEHGAPYHLWAKPKSERGWNTRRKPSVVLEAMDAYPGKALILMDVDCTVRGDIAPVTLVAGDVGINVKARQERRFRSLGKRITMTASSRVVVFRPTEAARAFAQEWQRLCASAHYAGDETAMACGPTFCAPTFPTAMSTRAAWPRGYGRRGRCADRP
jgi:hypothetical protein